MSQPDHLQRREVIAGLASIGAALTASSAGAQPGASAWCAAPIILPAG
jgi:hypothetical protein